MKLWLTALVQLTCKTGFNVMPCDIVFPDEHFACYELYAAPVRGSPFFW